MEIIVCYNDKRLYKKPAIPTFLRDSVYLVGIGKRLFLMLNNIIITQKRLPFLEESFFFLLIKMDCFSKMS